MNEDFKLIEGQESYGIASDGRVFSVKANKVLKTIKLKTGYMRVTLSGRAQSYVHRLVAIAYIDNPLNLPHVNHIDEDPSNNDISNLEWVTHKQNIHHSCKGNKSYLAKPKEYYETSGCVRADFKKICKVQDWVFKDFIETYSGKKSHSNKKYYYKEQ